MKVLILNGSTRPKGNTKQMIKAFCEGIETAGHEYGVYDVCKKGEGAIDRSDATMRVFARKIARIRTGGQSGVDRAALDFAIEHNIPYSGGVRRVAGRRIIRILPDCFGTIRN